MKRSDSLFELIHSLTKEEKRHFRLYIKKYNKVANYVLLFDAILEMPSYDKLVLQKQLDNLHFSSRLSIAKEYLYSLILRSLRDLEPATPAAEVRQMIADISQLLERRLYGHAKKKIKKAKELATAYDLFGERYILLDLEAYLPDADRNEMMANLEKHLREINEITETGKFAESVRQLNESKGRIRTPKDAEELEKLAASWRLIHAEKLLTFGARLRYYFGWSRYYEMSGNTGEAVKNLKSIIDLYHAYPLHIRTEQLGYVTTVMNYCTYQLQHGNHTMNQKYLQKVKELQANKQMIPFSELLIFRFEILEALTLEDWEKIKELYLKMAGLLSRHSKEAYSYGKDIRIDYYLFFAKAFFLQKQFTRALDELNTLRKLPTLTNYPYHENNVSILVLIVHFELGNLSYLPYLIRSTYRSLLRRERLFEFESLVLHYLRSLSRLKKQKEIVSSLEHLYSQITLLETQPIDREFPWREFYINWLEKKIHLLKSK